MGSVQLGYKTRLECLIFFTSVFSFSLLLNELIVQFPEMVNQIIKRIGRDIVYKKSSRNLMYCCRWILQSLP